MRLRLFFSTTIAALACGAVALAAVGERLARLNLEETELSREQAQNMSQLSRLLSVLEQLRRDPPPALLVSPADAKDAVRAAILVKAMTPELQRRAQSYAREAGEMTRQRRLAAVQSEALFTTDSLRADETPEPDLGLSLRPPTSSGEALVSPPETLRLPVAAPITRAFGETLRMGGRSNGLTFTTGPKAQISSPGAGTVQYVGPVKGWGVILIIKLAGGYHLVLAGLDRSSAAVGQSVAAGAPIGWMPDSRHSSTELYLEVRNQGSPVDPARWLKDKQD